MMQQIALELNITLFLEMPFVGVPSLGGALCFIGYWKVLSVAELNAHYHFVLVGL